MRYWYKIFVAKHNGQLMVSFKLKIFHVIQNVIDVYSLLWLSFLLQWQ